VGVTRTFILAALLCFSLGFLTSRLIFEDVDDVCRLLVAHSFPDELRGLKNSETVRSFAETLSVNWQTYHISRGDSEFVVFCFSKPEDAQASAERFGGERLPETRR
jgi:hypothetical protein